MKKSYNILALIVLLIISTTASTQSVIGRTSGANTIRDARLMASRNLFIPRYVDTIAANADKGIDTCGAVIYTYAGSIYWGRACSPKRWVKMGTPSAINGLSLTANNEIQLGGLMTKDDSIGLNSHILSIMSGSTRLVYFQPSPPNRFTLGVNTKFNEGTVTVDAQNYSELGIVTKMADYGVVSNDIFNLYETGVNPPGSVQGYSSAAAALTVGAVNSTNGVTAILLAGFKGYAFADSGTALFSNSKSFVIANSNVKAPIIFRGSFSPGINEWGRFDGTTGNFGIKTPTPAYPLDVNGDGRINGIYFNRATEFGGPQIITSEYLTIANTGSGTEGLTMFQSRSPNIPVEIRLTGGNGSSMSGGIGVIDGFNYDGPVGQRQALYIVTSGFNAQIVAKAGPIVLRPGTNYARFRELTQYTNDSVRVELNQAMTGRFYVSGKSTFTDSTNIFTRLGAATDSVLVKSAGGIVNATTSNGFIYNQFASAQTTADAWISGRLRVGNYLQVANAGRFVTDVNGDMSLTTSTTSTDGSTLRLRDIKFFSDVAPYTSPATATRISAPQNDFINIHTGGSGQIIMESPVVNFNGGGGSSAILTVGGIHPLHIRGNDAAPGVIDYLDLQNNNDAGLSAEATHVRLIFSGNRQNGSAIVHSVNPGTQQRFARIGVDIMDYTQTAYKGDLTFETVDGTVASGTPQEFMRIKYDGRVYMQAYASGLTAPTTSGTKHMLTVDVNGQLSHEVIPGGGGGGVTDHTALTNLSWTSSAHIGAANNIAGFNGSNVASLYTLTGTGTVLALATSPVLVTPLLGTPTSGVLTNTTGYLWDKIANPTSDQALTFGLGLSSTWTSANTIEDLFTVNTSTISSASLFSLNSTSTALISGGSLIKLVMTGVNANTSTTANPLKISVTNTGSASLNKGIDVSASGASTSWALYTGTGAGGDGRANFNNGTNTANQVIVAKSLTNTLSDGIILKSNDEATSLQIGPQILTSSGSMVFNSSSAGVQVQTKLYVGAAGTTPSAILELLAGTTSLAPMQWNSGALTTGGNIAAGNMEFLTDKWYGTITTGVLQKEFTMNDATLPTSRVPYTVTNGRLNSDIGFTFTPTTGLGLSLASTTSILSVGGAISPSIGSVGFVTQLGGNINEAVSGTHSILAGTVIFAPVITGGGAAVTSGASLYITGTPNAAGANNSALWAVGKLRLGQVGIVNGAIDMEGAASGVASIVVNAIAGNPQLLLPTESGTFVQFAEGSTVSSATPTPTGNARENFYDVTSLAANATFAAPSGALANHNILIMKVRDNATPRTLAFNSAYRGSVDIALPTTTTASLWMIMTFMYSTIDGKWDLVGLTNGF